MSIHRTVAVFCLALLATCVSSAAELSHYRDFQLGTTVKEVSALAGIPASEARLVWSRPERIEELVLKMDRTSPSETSSDPVKEMSFRFFRGKLFEITVTYIKDKTDGLSDTDMIEAITKTYGFTSKTGVKEMPFNSEYEDRVRVIARWQDAASQLNLVGFRFGRGFGMIFSSKSEAALAQRSMVESERLAYVEAPQRELATQRKLQEEARVNGEKSRSLNKPAFRP